MVGCTVPLGREDIRLCMSCVTCECESRELHGHGLSHETMSADDDEYSNEYKCGIEKSYTHGTGYADTVLSLTSVVHAVKNCAHPQPPSPLYCINGRAARLAAAPSQLP